MQLRQPLYLPPSSWRVFLFFLLFSLRAYFLPAQQRGELIADSLYFDYSLDQVDSLYQRLGLIPALAPIEYPIKVYRLVYYTPAPRGDSLTRASGLMFVPQDSCQWPVFSYQHGTNYYGSAPSELGLEWQLGVPFATGGYLVSMPDFVGFGATPKSVGHPYLHAKTEASASIDMLRAVRQWIAQQGRSLSDQLFLGGYSQGGHATIATQRSMEQDFPQEFAITAVAAGGGPYDLERTLTDYILTDSSRADAFFVAYTMMAYQQVYGNLWQDPSEAFVAPYDSIVPRYFDPLAPTPGPLPDTALNMLQPAYAAAVRQDSLHPARVALRENNLYAWAPQAPTRLSYCSADELVPFWNSLIARDSFLARGAPQVEALDLDPNAGHSACAFPMVFNTKFYFDNLKDSCVIDSFRQTSSLALAEGNSLRVYPQPARGEVFLEQNGRAWSGEKLTWQVVDLTGRVQQGGHLQPTGERLRLSLPALSTGLYCLILTQGQTQWQHSLYILP